TATRRTGRINLNSKTYGRQVWTKATKAWKEEQEEARRKKRTFKIPRPTLKAQRIGRIRDSLDWVGGVWEQTYHGDDDDMGYDEDNESDIAADADKIETDENWTVQKLYQGLVPVTLTTLWATLFGSSRASARYMAGRFTRALEDFERDVIWNRRCEITVGWERSMGSSL
ncbi:hypothetical protein BGZ51_000365, partial [Haplosporangium sp. Z 767]